MPAGGKKRVFFIIDKKRRDIGSRISKVAPPQRDCRWSSLDAQNAAAIVLNSGIVIKFRAIEDHCQSGGTSSPVLKELLLKYRLGDSSGIHCIPLLNSRAKNSACTAVQPRAQPVWIGQAGAGSSWIGAHFKLCRDYHISTTIPLKNADHTNYSIMLERSLYFLRLDVTGIKYKVPNYNNIGKAPPCSRQLINSSHRPWLC